MIDEKDLPFGPVPAHPILLAVPSCLADYFPVRV